jgi:hypothetical protein
MKLAENETFVAHENGGGTDRTIQPQNGSLARTVTGRYIQGDLVLDVKILVVSNGRTHIARLYVKLPTAQWWPMLLLLKLFTQIALVTVTI